MNSAISSRGVLKGPAPVIGPGRAVGVEGAQFPVEESAGAIGLVHAVEGVSQAQAVGLVGAFVEVEGGHIAAQPAVFVGFGFQQGGGGQGHAGLKNGGMQAVGLAAVGGIADHGALDGVVEAQGQRLGEDGRGVLQLGRVELDGGGCPPRRSPPGW